MTGFATREQRVQAIQKFDTELLLDAYTAHVSLLAEGDTLTGEVRDEYEFNRVILREEIRRRLDGEEV